ncbi:MAG: SH3 domain-containing protein [Bdellovibrionales bacterium]
MRHKTVMTIALWVLMALPAYAVDETDAGDKTLGASGLPIPRFASLRASDVNLRTGPGTRYPIDWVLTHQGLPIEIVAEYEMWRRVRDAEGDEGWVHKNALSGKRSAIVSGSSRQLRRDPDANAAVTAHLEPGAVGQILSCARDWCKLKFQGTRGYLQKTEFWGAYEEETFN